MQINKNMENVTFPEFLIFPKSYITIYFDNKRNFNSTKQSIVIEGSRNGFLSLANLLNVYNVYLYSPIILTEFPFVKSTIVFEISANNNVSLPNGKVIEDNQSKYIWLLSETSVFVITCLLHSLGYANNELHLDSDLQPGDISVYCVVNDD